MRLDHLLSKRKSRDCFAVEFSRTHTVLVVMRLGVTPVPIPNTMVKTQAADGTWLETARESRWLPDPFQSLRTLRKKRLVQKPTHGDVAQLGEHLPCKQGVKSSNLSISIGTTFRLRKAKAFGCTLTNSYRSNSIKTVELRSLLDFRIR